MNKYYTRACNFYYGINAKKLIKKKIALPLCGNKNLAFDKIEVIARKKNKVISKTISLKKIHTELRHIAGKAEQALDNNNIRFTATQRMKATKLCQSINHNADQVAEAISRYQK